MHIEEILADPSNYTKGRTQPIQFVVIHYVGAEGSARNNCLYFQKPNCKASAHYFVDHAPAAGIFRSVPDTSTAWHVGATHYTHPTCRNTNAIGIELCCKKKPDGIWYFDEETVSSAVQLTADLMYANKVGLGNLLRHFDVTGKDCPAPFHGGAGEQAWAEFKTRVAKELANR